jgi:hypothetical protein
MQPPAHLDLKRKERLTQYSSNSRVKVLDLENITITELSFSARTDIKAEKGSHTLLVLKEDSFMNLNM